jgi:nucleoid-associated protein YgaU
MPNDAKLGLVVGVGVVIAIAVIFSRKDIGPGRPLAPEAAAASVGTPNAPPPAPAAGTNRPIKAKSTARTLTPSEESATDRHHIVREGETLFSLAEQYYGDKEKFIELYQANRDVLKAPDPLVPGTDLVIPAQ